MPLIETAEQLVKAILERPRYVAECLQRLHRFGGQYAGCNVLIHSLEVAWMCRHELPHVQTWALLHDCHEIITGEIVRPAKTASVERLQDEIDWHIQSALGLKITAEHEMAVMRHDIDTGAAEYKYGDDMRYRYAGHDCVAIFDTMLTGRGGAF
jgi:hypothetical protein